MIPTAISLVGAVILGLDIFRHGQRADRKLRGHAQAHVDCGDFPTAIRRHGFVLPHWSEPSGRIRITPAAESPGIGVWRLI